MVDMFSQIHEADPTGRTYTLPRRFPGVTHKNLPYRASWSNYDS